MIEKDLGVADVDSLKVACIVPHHAKVTQCVDVLSAAAGKRVHERGAERPPYALGIASRDTRATFRCPKVDAHGGIKERGDDERAEQQGANLVFRDPSSM